MKKLFPGHFAFKTPPVSNEALSPFCLKVAASRVALLFLMLLACSCARKPGLPPTADARQEAVLQAYAATASPANAAAYRIKMSLRFGARGRTHRVTALLWGNGDRNIRLDIMAGIGATLAQIHSCGDVFRLYSQPERKEYWHEGASPLFSAGVPVPFDLGQLTNLLNGHYASVFGMPVDSARAQADGLLRVEVGGSLAGTLLLDASGRPAGWHGKSPDDSGWKLDMAYPDEPANALPERLELSHPHGEKCLLLVKDRIAQEKDYSGAQLRLVVPDGTPRLPLAEYR